MDKCRFESCWEYLSYWYESISLRNKGSRKTLVTHAGQSYSSAVWIGVKALSPFHCLLAQRLERPCHIGKNVGSSPTETTEKTGLALLSSQ